MVSRNVTCYRTRLHELRQRLRDDVMRMAIAPDCEMTMQLWSKKETILRQIEDSLERLENGTYGRCEECDRPIPRTRLEAVPYTNRCARCAGRLEASFRPGGEARSAVRPAPTIRRQEDAASRLPRHRMEARRARGEQAR